MSPGPVLASSVAVVPVEVSSATCPSDEGVELPFDALDEELELVLPDEFEELWFEDFDPVDCSVVAVELLPLSEVLAEGSRQKKNQRISQTMPAIMSREIINHTTRPTTDVFGCSYIAFGSSR
jgi:hypothetical protein